ncbi:MAG: thymidine phosphorylase [bacterium]|nr:thymidine phosphorylase [bacterium]
MDARDVLRTKRDGGELSPEEIDAFITGYSRGEIPDYVASALLMGIFQVGMAEGELAYWTRAMLNSGARLDLEGIEGPFVDKHSTGGVGDKVSLPLAPALAACGVRVPMVSGRGLGHTGGTLDKLESIEGFTTELALDDLRRVLESAGAVFGAQTADLVPADKKLYALRDATGLVESLPLIASSILSKKLAEGLDALVLDVKFGSGAFLGDAERGTELARAMLSIARSFELPTTVYQTSMEAPLGRAVGHALEIEETIACLNGGGPRDLRELVTTFGGELLAAVRRAPDRGAGAAAIAASLDDGSALTRFATIVELQGGDRRSVLEVDLPRAPHEHAFEAAGSGVLGFADCRAIGLAVCALGGGRRVPEDRIDPAVGIVWERTAGDPVRAGDLLARVHHRDGRGLDEALAHLASGVHFDASDRSPLVLKRLEA